jgi:hypothetical protein
MDLILFKRSVFIKELLKVFRNFDTLFFLLWEAQPYIECTQHTPLPTHTKSHWQSVTRTHVVQQIIRSNYAQFRHFPFAKQSAQ